MNKIIILAFVFSGLAGIGILGNSFFIDIQPLGMFASLDDLPGSICSCANSEGEFSPENCDQFMGDYSDNTEAICQQLAPLSEYGDPPLETQGCNADFWESSALSLTDSSDWPAGYSPNYYFNEMFQVSITLPDEEPDVVIDEDPSPTSDSLEIEQVETVNATGITEEIQLDSDGNNTISEPEALEEILDEVETSDAGNSINSNQNMGLNLAGALELQGNQLNDLLRESVTAMLNAAHSEINYPYTVAEIITMTQIALANEEYDETVKILKEANGSGNTTICNA